MYGTVASLQSAEVSDIKVWGGSASINVNLESHVGASVRVFDITGRVLVNEVAILSNQVYSISRAGLYTVQVVDANNTVKILKCLVK